MDTTRRDSFLLAVLLLILVLDRVLLLAYFGSRFTGVDDTVYWQAAEDYSHGIFREPFFYGQDYGYMAEAVLAVPFLWLGISHHVALPMVTNILALLPFIFLAWAFRRSGSIISAALCLLVPLALPIEHGVLTSMSRGFVSGLPFAALLFFCFFVPAERRAYLLFGCVAPFAFLVNPNTVPIIVLTGAYLCSRTVPDIRWYGLLLLPAIPLYWLHGSAEAFYETNPEYLVHWMADIEFSWTGLMDAVSQLDLYFKHLGPLFWGAGWIWLLLVGVLGAWAWPKDRRWSIVVICTAVSLLLMLGINKVRDGHESIFHSRERMYLAFPVIVAFTIGWTARLFQWSGRGWNGALIMLGIALFGIKSGYQSVIINGLTTNEDQGPVAIVPMERLVHDCSRLAALADAADADVIVMVPDHGKTTSMQGVRTYACPLIEPRMKDTFLIVGERRTWMYKRQAVAIPKNVIIYGQVQVPDSLPHGSRVLRLDHDLLLIQGNAQPLGTLLGTCGAAMKRHLYM